MYAENDGDSRNVKECQINPGIKRENPDPECKDNWKHRSEGMKCKTCMFYVPKGEVIGFGRCRRNAPTMNGYPAVYATDWCGEHKMDEEKLLCG